MPGTPGTEHIAQVPVRTGPLDLGLGQGRVLGLPGTGRGELGQRLPQVGVGRGQLEQHQGQPGADEPAGCQQQL